MKVYTDISNTTYFKTDKYIKNLRAVHINSIREFLRDHSLDPMMLLGAKHWMVGRFDELFAGDFDVDSSDEPELIGECINIDFIPDDMQQLDVLAVCIICVGLPESCFLVELQEHRVFADVTREFDDDDQEIWTIKSHSDDRVLKIIVDIDDKVTTRFE